MNKDKLYIDLPNDKEIEKQISLIVQKSIEPKESSYSYVIRMYKEIGFKNLFHDAGEIILTIILIFSFLLSVISTFRSNHMIKDIDIYFFIFTISPILYLIMSLISFVNTRQKCTYEIEMTCKYNIYQLAVLRMLIFSILCILLNSVLVYATFIIYKKISFIRTLMISVTSLFFFASVFLYIIFTVNTKSAKYIVTIGWLLLNLILYKFAVEMYIMLLKNVPVYVYLIVTTLCIYIYLKKLKEFVRFTNVKGAV